jgi:ubiquinone/menaquinone biosynthesis C-methylase UbiE
MNSNDVISIKSTNILLDHFLSLSLKLALKHPTIVVILMHEYFRNMYPTDPYINTRYSEDILTNINLCLKNNIQILDAFEKVGSYNAEINLQNTSPKNDISRMSNLFGALWQKRFESNVLNSKKVINDLFAANKLNLSKIIKDKHVVDIGCGSGRFSIALSQLGAKQVTAVDINPQGIALGRKFAKESKINNVSFIEHNVLELPFEDETFDFVFSKGVLHHTGNLDKAIGEYSRVLKKNGHGFLYLYANGGLYWESRKKMREIMKLIPMEFSIQVLESIGMPARRTIFVDSWYVPVEDYVKSEYIEEKFNKLKYRTIQRMKSSRAFELDKIVLENGDWAKDLWGEGELRYFLKK